MGSIDVNRSKIIKVVDIALGREQSNYAAVGHDVTGIIHGAVKINSFPLSPYFSLTVIFHVDCAGLLHAVEPFEDVHYYGHKPDSDHRGYDVEKHRRLHAVMKKDGRPTEAEKEIDEVAECIEI